MPPLPGRNPAAPPGRIAALPQRGLINTRVYTTFDEPTLAAFFDQSVGSTASIDTARSKTGANALKIHQTGSASGTIKKRQQGYVEVVRFWFNVDALPAANCLLFGFDVAAGNFAIRLTSGGALGGLWNGATAQTYDAALPLDTWHSIDILIDTRGTTYTADVRYNGAAQTQAVTAAGQKPGMIIDTIKVGFSGATTIDYWFDDIQAVANNPGAYPLSDVGTPPAFYDLPIGFIPSAKAIRGLDSPLSAGTGVPIGHINSLKAVRGIDNTISLTPTAIGHINSPKAVRGLGQSTSLTPTAIGKITGHPVVRGIGTTVSLVATAIGKITGHPVVRGLNPRHIFYRTSFETESAVSDIFDITAGSTASLDTAQQHSGAKSLLIHQTGTAAPSTKDLPYDVQQCVGRVWFYLPANPSATLSIIRTSTPAAATSGCILRITTAGKLQILFNGGTSQTSAASFNLNAWNSIDWLIDTSGTTYTLDAKLNGVALTQATISDAQHPQEDLRVAFGGNITLDFWYDQLKLSDRAADYPLTDDSSAAFYNLPIGHIIGPKAVRGLGISIVLTPSGIGHINSPKAVRGLGQSTSLVKTKIGKMDTPSRTLHAIKMGSSTQVLGGQDLDVLGLKLGRPFVGLRQNNGPSITTFGAAQTQWNQGKRLYYRVIQLDTNNDYTTVTSGGYDTELAAIWANALALMSGGFHSPKWPLYLAVSHEMSFHPNAGTPQQYIDAFRYIVNSSEAAGVPIWGKAGNYIGGPVVWCLAGNNRMFVDVNGNLPPDVGDNIREFNPDGGTSPAPAGTTYFTLVGSSLYNDYSTGETYKFGTTADVLLQPIIDYSVEIGKKWFLGEMGYADGASGASHTAKASLVTGFFDIVKTCLGNSPGDCEFICSTQKFSSENYNADSSPDSLAAWKTMMTDHRFAGYLGPVVRGLGASYAGTITIGKIPGIRAVRGLGAITVLTATLGKIPSPKAVRGIAPAPTGFKAALGKIPGIRAVRGLGTTIFTPYTPDLHIIPLYDGREEISLETPVESVPVFSNRLAVKVYNTTVMTLPTYARRFSQDVGA